MHWQVQEAGCNTGRGTSVVIHFYNDDHSYKVAYGRSVFWGHSRVNIEIHIYDKKRPTLITTEYKFVFDHEGKRCMKIVHCEKEGRIRSSEVILEEHLLRGVLIAENVAENMWSELTNADVIAESLLSPNPNIRAIAEHLVRDHSAI